MIKKKKTKKKKIIYMIKAGFLGFDMPLAVCYEQ